MSRLQLGVTKQRQTDKNSKNIQKLRRIKTVYSSTGRGASGRRGNDNKICTILVKYGNDCNWGIFVRCAQAASRWSWVLV